MRPSLIIVDTAGELSSNSRAVVRPPVERRRSTWPTTRPTAPSRRSAQTAMYLMSDGLARLLAPILPVTADEMWRHLPGPREDSVHLAEFPGRASVAELVDADLVARWQRLIGIRDEVNRALESARQGKTIGNSLGARVVLSAGGATAELLTRYRDDLPMLFIVSQVSLETAGTEDTLAIETECPSIQYAAAFMSPVDFFGGPFTQRVNVRYREIEMTNAAVQGASPSYFKMGVTNIAEGRYFSDEDRWSRQTCLCYSDVVSPEGGFR